MLRLQNKVALVTGASRGIGNGIAKKLAQEGARVAINYGSNAEQARKAVAEIKQAGGEAMALQADVSQISEIERFVSQVVEQYGKLDIAVSNAGVEYFKALDDVTPDEFDHIFAVNTRGQFFVMQQAARHMEAGGRLVCLSSVSAHHGFRNHAVYAGSKAAIEGFVCNLAVELGNRGITVNAIAPGATKTDMASKFGDFYRDPDSQLSLDEQMMRLSPLGRWGTPQDIANVVAFLVSDEGGWLTGQVIHVTGGMI